MRINADDKTWVSVKKLKTYLTNEMRRIKANGKSPVILGKRIVGKNGKVTFVPTEVTSAEVYKERMKMKKKTSPRKNKR